MKKVYLVAVVVALIAGICTWLFANQLFKTVSAKSADTTKVLVPVETIQKNTVITAADVPVKFKEIKVFNNDLIENVILDGNDLIGKVTGETLYANEQINKNRMIDKDSDVATLSVNLEKGFVAYTIVAEGDQGVDGYIQEGDSVDLSFLLATKDEIEKFVNGDEDEEGEDGSDSDTNKSDKKKDAKDKKDRLDELEENFPVETFSALEVIKVSDNLSVSTAEGNDEKVTTYKNITLKISEGMADKILQIEKVFGKESYKLKLRPRGTVSDNK